MFTLSVERSFAAAHSIVIRGGREPVHGHNWNVTAFITGSELDADGLLVDFHLIEAALDDIIRPLHNADLNGVPPFDRVNPTVENVARHIAAQLSVSLAQLGGAPSARVDSVRVTEAPGCAVTYRPSSPAAATSPQGGPH